MYTGDIYLTSPKHEPVVPRILACKINFGYKYYTGQRK